MPARKPICATQGPLPNSSGPSDGLVHQASSRPARPRDCQYSSTAAAALCRVRAKVVPLGPQVASRAGLMTLLRGSAQRLRQAPGSPQTRSFARPGSPSFRWSPDQPCPMPSAYTAATPTLIRGYSVSRRAKLGGHGHTSPPRHYDGGAAKFSIRQPISLISRQRSTNDDPPRHRRADCE